MEVLTSLLEEVNITESGSFEKSLKNLDIRVSAVNPRSFQGLTFSGMVTNSSSQSGNVTSRPRSKATIQLPSTLFEDSTTGNTSRPSLAVFTLYKQPKLFSARSRKTSKRLNSQVVAAKLKNFTISNLTTPVVLTYKSLKPGDKSNVECAFWSFAKADWSSEGCSFVDISDGGTVTCHCTHLTNFAMLMVS